MNHSPLFATRSQTGLSPRMVAPFSSRDHLRRRPPPPNPQYGGAKKEGCALTAPPVDGKKRSCHAVSMEENDPVGCSRSPNNRCIVRPEPRKCEYYQAKTSPRCRTTKDGDHDDRCTLNEKGRCALTSAAKSPRKPRVPKQKLSRPKLGLPVKLTRTTSAPLPPSSSYTGGYVFY
jgi:hypothetical protein